jgi:L-ascorbate metabolism protein UlaG (beta-lactamase superfamily)
MKITWFGHSAFRVEIAGSVLLIDPFLSDNPVFDGSVEDAARGVTHVALTHGHADHIGDTAKSAPTAARR